MSKQELVPLIEKGERVSDLFFDRQTEVIYFKKSIGGRKIKFTTRLKLPQVSKAKRMANLRLQDILGTKSKYLSPLIKDELPIWLESKEAEGLDPATLHKVRDAIKRIRPFWGSMLTSEITRDNLVRWYAWLGETFPGQQKENAVKYLSNFARYLAEKQHNGRALLPAVPRIVDPDKKKVLADRKRRKGRIFTDAEFKAIYKAAPGPREKVLALIMFTMATRVNEALSLKRGVEVIESSDGLVYRWSFGQNKADLTGEHYFHTKTAKAIRSIYRDDTDYLFPQKSLKGPLKAQQIDWEGWRKRANLDWHWTSHTFRHTCLSNLFNDEKNPQALICKLYRVSLAVALDIYVKPTSAGILKMRDSLRVSI